MLTMIQRYRFVHRPVGVKQDDEIDDDDNDDDDDENIMVVDDDDDDDDDGDDDMGKSPNHWRDVNTIERADFVQALIWENDIRNTTIFKI